MCNNKKILSCGIVLVSYSVILFQLRQEEYLHTQVSGMHVCADTVALRAYIM